MNSLVILLLIALLVVALGVVAWKKSKKQKFEVDFLTLFILGIVWIPLGFATDNIAFTIIGTALVIIGFANKKKWKNRKKWTDLDPQARKTQIVLITILGLLLLAGILVFMLAK